MGNAASLDTAEDDGLALVAVANYTSLTQAQVLELRSNCRMGSLGQKRARPKISRASFQKAMLRSRIQHEEWDVFQQLFTLWDHDGQERVDFVEFLAGTSVLACGNCDSIEQVLLFALQVMDINNTKNISQQSLETLLNGINATASYFGDKVFSKQQLQVIANSVFQNLESNETTGHVPHSQCAMYLEIHPMIQQFISGCGQYKYAPSKHEMVKTTCNDDKVQKELFVHGGVVRIIDGTAAIGSSSSSEECGEI